MYPNINPACNRCGQSPAWRRPRITTYWQNIPSRPVDANPLTALFGIKGSDLVLTSFQHNMILFMTLLGRRLILYYYIIKLEANKLLPVLPL